MKTAIRAVLLATLLSTPIAANARRIGPGCGP